MSFLETTVPQPDQTDVSTWRYFWVNPAGGVSYLDFGWTSYSDLAGPRVVTGEIHEPFVYAASGVEVYEGRGTRVTDIQISAPITQFSDLQCKEPL